MADAIGVWEAILLGIVQGVTEWLPVSSSGHLVIVRHLTGTQAPLFFDLWVHVATLLVILVHYRRRVLAMTVAVLAWPRGEAGGQERRYALLVVVGTLPIVIAGLLGRDNIEAAFRSVRAVGWSLLLTTALLVSTHWARPREGFGPLRALLVGCFQALALLPGVSRSGATIAGALHAGLDREKATEYAFLLFIPALVGAVVLLLPDALREGVALPWEVYVAGFVASAAVGYVSLRFLLGVVRRWGLLPFAPYTLAVGVWLLLI